MKTEEEKDPIAKRLASACLFGSFRVHPAGSFTSAKIGLKSKAPLWFDAYCAILKRVSSSIIVNKYLMSPLILTYISSFSMSPQFVGLSGEVAFHQSDILLNPVIDSLLRDINALQSEKVLHPAEGFTGEI
jgi:hypothetical protein